MIYEVNSTLLLSIINPLAVIIMLTFGLIKLRQAKKGNQYNLVLALFFLTITTGILVQISYFLLSPMLSDTLYIFLGRLSGILLMFALVFPIFFIIALQKSFMSIGKNDIWKVFGPSLFYSLLSLVIGTTDLDENRFFHFTLSWTIYMLAYAIAIIIIFCVVALRLLKEFSEKELKKRFVRFILGFLVISSVYIDIVLMSSGLINRGFATYYNSLGLIVGCILIYLGIIFKKKQ